MPSRYRSRCTTSSPRRSSRRSGSEVQQGLTTLSVAPVLDRELVGALLGDAAEVVTATHSTSAFSSSATPRLDLHPLARAFLEEKSDQIGLVPAEGAGEACLAHYRQRRDWDAAFELIVRHGWAQELEATPVRGHRRAARLGTTLDARTVVRLRVRRRPRCRRSSRWRARKCCSATAAISRRSPMPSPLRMPDGEHVFRALSVAGRAAHLASREEEALELYRARRARRVRLSSNVAMRCGANSTASLISSDPDALRARWSDCRPAFRSQIHGSGFVRRVIGSSLQLRLGSIRP